MRKWIALGVFCAVLGLSPVVAQAASSDVRQGVSPAPSIGEIIQSDPDLRRWNQDPLAWAVAQAVDAKLALKPEYAGRPFSERQAEVVRITRLRLGETDGRDEAALPRPAPNAEPKAAFRGDSRVPLSNDQYAAAHSGIRILARSPLDGLCFT